MNALGKKLVNTGYAIGKKLTSAGALGLKNLQVGARKASHTLEDINRAYDSSAGKEVRNLINLVPGGSYATGIANDVRNLSGKAQRGLDRARSTLQKSDVVQRVNKSFA
jgi:hypothetical protein